MGYVWVGFIGVYDCYLYCCGCCVYGDGVVWCVGVFVWYVWWLGSGIGYCWFVDGGGNFDVFCWFVEVGGCVGVDVVDVGVGGDGVFGGIVVW